ncbi:hypothetical protein NoPa_00087 [Pseudomonas phage vB_PpuM-NoPa]|uniref:Uncharacterized protein n=4 Tax=Tartuvirus TaxID=3424912 RepID=A0AAX4MX24_9CAUD
MLNERERSRLVSSDTRDLKSELESLKGELDYTYLAARRQWIADRIGFIESLLAERNTP